MNAPAALLVTTAELCDMLAADGVGDITPEVVRQWLRDPMPPPVAAPGRQGQSHRWDYDDVLEWLAARANRPRAKGWTAPGSRASDPRQEKLQQEARIRRLEADKMEGHLVPADEIEKAWGLMVDAQRAAWLGLRDRLVQALETCTTPAERGAAIAAEVDLQLARLARGLPDDEGAEQ